jgi:hypothetical protein
MNGALSTDQAYELLASWLKTGVRAADNRRSAQDIRVVMVEVLGAAETLEAAFEWEALRRPGLELETKGHPQKIKMIFIFDAGDDTSVYTCEANKGRRFGMTPRKNPCSDEGVITHDP